MRGLVFVLIVLLAFACNGGGEALRTATPGPSPSATPAATATPTAAATPAALKPCPASWLDPYEMPIDLGDQTRYSRGIYTIGPDGTGLTLLADRADAPFGIRTYSLSSSGRFLAFVAGKYPSQTICLASVDGDERPRALATFESMWDMALSPNGKQVVVYGRLDDTEGVYLVATQDGAVAPFPTPLHSAQGMRWSPAGDQLAFFGKPGPDSPIGVYVVNADGSDLRWAAGQDATASWSPDGSRIAYTVFAGPDAGILLVDGEGNVTRLSKTTPHRRIAPAWALDGRRIAFVEAGETEEVLQISIVDVDSGEEVLLTRGTYPAWSPDGSRVAFVRDGNLYVVNADGSQETKLTNASQPFVAEPSWLPDGSRLLFSFVPPFDGSVHVINPDGSDEVRLADGWGPVWSPDGKRIAFVGGGSGPGLGGRSDIYVMKSDGTQVRKVAEYKWSDVGPECFSWAKYAWSPDSRFIVYHSMVDRRIFLARADGEGEAVEIAEGGDADWSPDGSRIAFSCVRMPCKVYLTDPEGEREAEELTDGKSPAWAPDGKRIAFSRRGALHVINADGTGERELPASVGWGQQPVWSPDGSRIAVVFETTIVVVDVEDGQAIDVALGRDPTWSPDGSKIAFAVYSVRGPGSIYIVDADGSGEPQRLTRGEYPAWSPDGSRIAFTR